jgi:hypothetical protein
VIEYPETQPDIRAALTGVNQIATKSKKTAAKKTAVVKKAANGNGAAKGLEVIATIVETIQRRERSHFRGMSGGAGQGRRLDSRGDGN